MKFKKKMGLKSCMSNEKNYPYFLKFKTFKYSYNCSRPNIFISNFQLFVFKSRNTNLLTKT